MKLTIIIVNYNTQALLKQTLESVPHHDDWHIVVVDNGSSDGSIKMVQQEFPRVELLDNHQNVGFAKANNQVLRRGDSTYYLLLNSDTQVAAGAIEAMVEYMETHPRVGALTPKVVLPSGKLDPACHRGFPTPWRSLCYYLGLEKLFPHSKLFGGYHQAYLPFTTTHEIETTAGTAMMVRQAMMNEVGFLDEQFFMYAEDLDWCYRMSHQDWKIVYLPTAVVTHYKSQSGLKRKSKVESRKSKVSFYDTMWLFYQKHYRQVYPAWVHVLMYAGIQVKKWWSLG